MISLTILFCGAFLFWLGAVYLALTVPIPKEGGQYIEGSISQPRYVNPILSQTSEADADLVMLLYSGLFGYDAEGKLEKRMASEYTISEDGKLYTVFLKTGILFHDGEEMTAEDVIFTIRAIQDPAYKSPLRSVWQGIEVKAPDRYTVVFSLKKPYFGFLDYLTVGILPKHLWESISPDRFTLAEYNLIQPVGTGPYQYAGLEKDKEGNILSYHVRSFEKYFLDTPLIEKITFRFYPNEESLIKAFNQGEVLGIHSISPKNLSQLSEKKNPRIYRLNMPRTFNLFLNTNKSVPLAFDEVREALALSVDRMGIIETVLAGKGTALFGPIPPFMEAYMQAEGPPVVVYDVARANQILDEKGWSRGADGVRSREGVVLAFEIVTPDWPMLMETADLLREQWKQIGASVEVKTLSQADLQQNVIRPREYQALLFGQALMLNPDLFSFWHSTQKNDPGLNFAFFGNDRVDEILQEAQVSIESEKRAVLYQELQSIFEREHPAIFLYSPSYLYVVGGSVQGVQERILNTPSERLSNIDHWYLRTKRTWKNIFEDVQ